MTAGPPLIAHLIYRLDIGGLENGLVNLLNRLPRDRYRHVVLCLTGTNPESAARIQRKDVAVISLGKKPGKDLAVYARLYARLRSLRPTLVHTRNLGTIDLQWIAAAAGVPHRVHGEHGWEATDPRGQNRRNLLIRRACRPVIHRYVPMSRDLASWLERDVGVVPSRIRQLYSGVDTERFKGDPTRARRIPGDGPVIGTVGRLDPVKGQSALLDAFAALRPAHPAARLLLVGDGPLRAALESQAASLGVADAVAFAGARLDTPELLRAMDVFVLPSLNEGISNTILEAMAAGLPVVASRVGGNPELVVDEVTGALYDPTRPEGLVEALGPYLADPQRRSAHGRAGRERVLRDFSLDAMVQRYQALYDELLSMPSARMRGERAGVRGF